MELQLGLDLTKCFTSRMAIWLTYLAAITNTRNLTYDYCKKKHFAAFGRAEFS